MDNFLEFLGRLHPLVVHFPIALILTGGAIELLRGGKEKPSEAGVVCLGLGAVSALVAIGAGWLHADHVDVGSSMETVLFRHRWVGVGVASVSSITALLTWRMRVAPSSTLGVAVRTGLITSMLLVGYDGHLGGTLVYGEGYLIDALFSDKPSVEKEPTTSVLENSPTVTQENDVSEVVAIGPGATEIPDSNAGTDAPGDTTGANEIAQAKDVATPTVSYARDVLPILEARCYKCHGPSGKARGGLRLNDIPDLYEGDEEFWLIHPGSAEKSVLYQLIVLPADDLDIMPASGDPLTAAEIDLIKRWIEEGATVGAPKAATGGDTLPDEGEPQAGEAYEEAGDTELTEDPVLASATTLPDSELTQDLEVQLDDAQRAARDRALLELRKQGAHAVRVAQNTDGVEVHLGLMGELVTDETLGLLQGLEPCLVSLDLSRTKITDEGLEPLGGFLHLRRLRLDQTEIGDAGVARLQGLAQLESLNLFQTRVGDAGLASLGRLSRLKKLYVWRSAATPGGIAALREALPKLTVIAGGDEAPGADAGDEEEALSGKEQ